MSKRKGRQQKRSSTNKVVIIEVKTKTMGQANKSQMRILTTFMEENGDLAKSYSAGSNGKESHKMLWEKLAKSLNENGPPMKTTREWKRIWTTRKYAAKKKLTENKNFMKKTGGGPFTELALDADEEAIVKVCGMEAAVAGISGAFSYGDEDQLLDEIWNADSPPKPPETNNNKQQSTNKKKVATVEESIHLARRQVELQEQFLSVQVAMQGSLHSLDKTMQEVSETMKSICKDFVF